MLPLHGIISLLVGSKECFETSHIIKSNIPQKRLKADDRTWDTEVHVKGSECEGQTDDLPSGHKHSLIPATACSEHSLFQCLQRW